MARAQNTHVVMRSSYGRDTVFDRLRTGFAEVVTGGQYQPQKADLDVDPSLVSHETDRITKLMVNEYLERLAGGGPQAAHAYARSVFAKQNLAMRQALEIGHQEAEQNELTGAFAGAAARGLDDVIVTCEVLLAVGSLAIGIGAVAAPALLMTATGGMSVEAAGLVSFGLSQGYNIVSKAVTVTSVSEIKAVAINVAKDGAVGGLTFASGYGFSKLNERGEDRKKIAEATHKAAETKVHELNKRLVGKMPFIPRKLTEFDRWRTVRQMNGAASQIEKAETAIKVGGAGARIFPVIQFAADIFSTVSGHNSRMKMLGPN